jgi:autophagy-related protein 2
MPEVGPTPDLIEDDLPSNPEYIDDSYGTAAGFRALDDDFEDEEFAITDVSERGSDERVTVLAGGETIRMLVPEPLHVEEHHFDTIPPEANQLDVRRVSLISSMISSLNIP